MTALAVSSVRGRPHGPRSGRRIDGRWRGGRAPAGVRRPALVLPPAHVPPFEREAAVMRAWFTGQSHGRAPGEKSLAAYGTRLLSPPANRCAT